MKSSLRSLLFVVVFSIPALVQAHPGHDGDHELVWDFTHLANHPLATLCCLAVLTGVGLGVWKFWCSRTAKLSK